MTVIEAARPSPHKPANRAPARPATANGGPASAGPASSGPDTRGLPRGGPAADTPVTSEPRPLMRRARLVALAVGCFLVPWCVLLGLTLPTTAVAQHWSLAWAGLDGAEAVAALATAVLLRRSDPRAGLTAVAGGTLLLADAWFDFCTSAPGLDRAVAVAEAFCLELPLACVAFWLAFRLTRATTESRPEQRPTVARPQLFQAQRAVAGAGPLHLSGPTGP